MSDIITAWHFLPADRRLRYGDGRRVRTGCWHAVQFPYTSPEDGRKYDSPSLCEAGMHASIRALDALQYAPGPIVGLCQIRGTEGETLFRGGDEIVGEARRYVAIADATHVLHHFACDEAERALNRHIPEPDERSLNAIRVKRLWIEGKASDAELAAAWAAAKDAAWADAQAWNAAWAAARAAANERLEAKLLSLLQCEKPS